MLGNYKSTTTFGYEMGGCGMFVGNVKYFQVTNVQESAKEPCSISGN